MEEHFVVASSSGWKRHESEHASEVWQKGIGSSPANVGVGGTKGVDTEWRGGRH